MNDAIIKTRIKKLLELSRMSMALEDIALVVGEQNGYVMELIANDPLFVVEDLGRHWRLRREGE